MNIHEFFVMQVDLRGREGKFKDLGNPKNPGILGRGREFHDLKNPEIIKNSKNGRFLGGGRGKGL